MKSFVALLSLSLSLFGACASLEQSVRLEGLEAGSRRTPASVELNQEDYRVALARWPWIRDGAQLHRRTLILSLRPSFDQLKILDANQDSAQEIAILSRLAPN